MAIALQSDGKIIIGGIMNTVPVGDSRSIYRLNEDGNIDTSFASGVYVNGSIRSIAVQSDGKIILSGYFSTYNGVAKKNIVRINAAGVLDASFNSPVIEGTIRTLAVQSDGKVLIGGGFILNDSPYWRNLARLNVDGGVDTGFSYGGIITGSDSVNAIAIQPDGKIIIGGYFRIYLSDMGVFINNIARLNDNGTLDRSFSLNAGNTAAWMGFVGSNSTGYVNDIVIRSDEKIIIVGSFGRLNILNVDGKLYSDSGVWNGQILSVTQSSDKIIIGGDFTVYNGSPSNYVAHLDGNGVYNEACSVVDLSDNFNNSSFTTKKNLVIITHGWKGSAYDRGDDKSWVSAMQKDICNRIDRDKTTVGIYDWEEKANTALPNDAYENARTQGFLLASSVVSLLRNNEIQLNNVHFIAHSAGSNLIQTAVKSLDTYYSNNSIMRPFIQLTFLDAFAPNLENEDYGKLYNFPNGYAEQYVNMIEPDGSPFTGPYTNVKLPNATNFDVTYLTSESNQTHEWPYKFYGMTVENSLSYNLGFPFSVESKNRIAHGDLIGKLCVVTDITRPYNSCVDNEIEATIKLSGDAISALGNAAVSITTSTIETSIDIGTAVVDGVSKAVTGTAELVENTTNQILDQFTGLFSFHLTTGSPSWIKLDMIAKEPISILEFNRIFPEQNSKGVFAVYVDNEEVFTEYISSENIGINSHKQILLPEKLSEGSHEIVLRIDPLSENHSDVYIADLMFGTQESVDEIVPETNISTSGTQGNNDWFMSDVQVTLSADDGQDGSGVDKTEYSLDGGNTWITYFELFTITNEGTHEIKYRSIDKAGNVEDTQIKEIKIDKTAPIIVVNTPTDGQKYVLNLSVNADWSATDVTSGLDTAKGTVESGKAIDTSSVVEHTFEVVATDKAGNTITKDFTYEVVYNFGGFQKPVANEKSFSGNGTIPVIFQLTDANGKYIATADAKLQVDGDDAVSSGKSNEGSTFRYDETANQYIFNLSLKNSSLKAGKHMLEITLNDGTKYSQEITVQ